MSIATIESALVTRLNSRMGGVVERIYTAAELAQVPEQSQLTPALAVVYEGYTPADDINHVVQQVRFRFSVVVMTRSASNTDTQVGARTDASPLVDQVIEALLGYRFSQPGYSTPRLVDAPGAGFSPGFAYYPIGFDIARTYRAT